MTHKYALGQPFMYPRNDLNFAENFLYMCFAVPAEPYEVNPLLATAMDKSLRCTPIMSKTRPHPLCVWPDHRRPIRLRALRRVLPPSGEPLMAGRTRRC